MNIRTGKETSRRFKSVHQPPELEQPRSPEQTHLERLRFHCRTIINETEKLLQTQYPPDEYPFHNIHHAKQISRDTVALLTEIRNIDPDLVTEADIIFGEVEGMRHDIPQAIGQFDGQGYDPRSLRIVRKRGFDPEQIKVADRPKDFIPGNEQVAADQIITIVRQKQYEDTFSIFTDESIQMDIGATYPKERLELIPDEYLPDHLKGQPIFFMTQPFARKATIRGVCLALADLKEAGGRIIDQYAPAERAIDAGNKEFRELYAGISKQLRDTSQDGQTHVLLGLDVQTRIVEIMINWKQAQEGFYLGQRYDLDGILDENPAINASPHAGMIKSMLRERYSGFETIAGGLREEYIEILEQLGLMYDMNGQALPLREVIVLTEQAYNRIAEQQELLLTRSKSGPLLTHKQSRQLDGLTQDLQIHQKNLEELKALERQRIKAVTPEQFVYLLKKFGY